MRPIDIVPKPMLDELLRLGRLDREWAVFEELEWPQYRCAPKYPTWLTRINGNGADYFSQLAISTWLVDGPKVFRPTAEQCAALEQIEVRVSLEDYSQPYPALAVELPRELYDSYVCCVCFRHPRPYFIGCLFSRDHLHDITTTVARNDGEYMEKSLTSFEENCREDAPWASRVLRVACNACLALSHYGSHLNYLFPKEVDSDRRLARENSERGNRAKRRLSLAVQVASFDQEVVLHRTERKKWEGEPGCSGREMPPHWRRGHWRTQPCGIGRSQRKRILVPPVMVRADLFVGQPSNTEVTYS